MSRERSNTMAITQKLTDLEYALNELDLQMALGTSDRVLIHMLIEIIRKFLVPRTSD